MLRTYLVNVEVAHNATQGRFMIRVLSQARVYTLRYDSQARGICLEVIVDEYNSL